MTRLEYIDAVSAYRKRVLMALVAALVLCGLYVTVLMVNVRPWTAFLEQRFAPTTAEILKGLLIAPCIPLLFACIGLGEYPANRDSRLRCPYCKGDLRNLRTLVIATRNCPHCGERAIAD